MWLDRFERVGSQLKAVGITDTGSVSLLDPERMGGSRLGSGLYTTVRLNTSFSEWNRASARDYAKTFGIQSGVTDSHEVFSVPNRGLDIVIPAWELQRTLLRAPSALADFTYRPDGLDHLCSPVFGSGEFAIALRSPVASGKPAFQDFLINTLPWFYAYPSARHTWNSVYRHACAGRIAIDLPKADVQISAHGKIVDGLLFARSVYAFQMTPLERPYDWALNVRKTYNLDHGRTRYIKSRRVGDFRLRPIGAKWNLTDSEWQTVEDIAFQWRLQKWGGAELKDDPRKVIDGIVFKMGTGCSWAELRDLQAGYVACAKLFYRMKADGRWDRIIDFLTTSRHEK